MSAKGIKVSDSSFENATSREHVYDGIPSETCASPNIKTKTERDYADKTCRSEIHLNLPSSELTCVEKDDSADVSLREILILPGKMMKESSPKRSGKASASELADLSFVEMMKSTSPRDLTTATTSVNNLVKLEPTSWSLGQVTQEPSRTVSTPDFSGHDSNFSLKSVHRPASMARDFRHNTRFQSLRRKFIRNMRWRTFITPEQRTGKQARVLLDGTLDVTLPPISKNDICKVVKMVIISSTLETTVFVIWFAFSRYRRQWWFEFVRGGLLWASPWFALSSTTILFLVSDRHNTRNQYLALNFLVVYIIVNSIYFFRYWLDLHPLGFVTGLLGSLSSIILCPWLIIKWARLRKFYKFKWIALQFVFMYSVCSYLLNLIILRMDSHGAMIFCATFPFVLIPMTASVQWTIQKMLIGTADNNLLVTFFGMLWNVNLEGVRFLSFIALIIQAVHVGWNISSMCLVIGNLIANLITKIWNLGGVRFLLMPKLTPCCYNYEGEILKKVYYSTQTVTEYSAPVLWMIITIFEGIPVCSGMLIPIEANEEKQQRMSTFWNLCYRNIYIILGIYVGSSLLSDLISYRISLIHSRMTLVSVYDIAPFFMTVLALINGYFLLYTFSNFSIVTEILLTREGVIEL